MNWEMVEANWKQTKGSIKSRWGKLTDDDIDMLDGKKDILIGKIQERYGLDKQAAEKELDSFLDSL